MIHNDAEYDSTVANFNDLLKQLDDQRERMRRSGMTEEHIEELLGDLKARCERMEEEVETYERHTTRTWIAPE